MSYQANDLGYSEIGALSEIMVTSSLKKGENENRSCSLLPNP
jgi:hypothetical protein